jgi:pentatricopeptide repeat protein
MFMKFKVQIIIVSFLILSIQNSFANPQKSSENFNQLAINDSINMFRQQYRNENYLSDSNFLSSNKLAESSGLNEAKPESDDPINLHSIINAPDYFSDQINDCKKELESYPNDVQLIYKLGNLYVKNNQIEEAEKVYKKLKSLNLPLAEELVIKISDKTDTITLCRCPRSYKINEAARNKELKK